MLRWRKVLPVLRREYLSRVQTKAFWISTISVPVLMIGATLLPTWVMSRTGGEYQIAVVTADAGLAQDLARVIAERTSRHAATGRLQVTVRQVTPEGEPSAQRLRVKRQVADKELAGVIWLPEVGVAKGEVEYLTSNVTAFRLIGALESAVANVLLRRQLSRAGVPADRLDELTRRVELHPVRIADDLGETADAAFEKSFALSYILSLTVYMTVLFYGYYVLRGVLEEKSSRIVEIIVANLRPMELMVGKIFGVGAVGLTQYAIWVVLAVNTGAIGALAGAAMPSATLVPPHLLVFFIVFFILGYFQFAALYAAVGSAFNSEEEAQQTQSLVALVMVFAIVLMMPVMSSPDSTLSVVVSLIPFFAPVLFFTRMTVQTPPTWQIVLCLVLLVANVFVVARFAAAVYRVGILMYGKKPTLREIWQWARSG